MLGVVFDEPYHVAVFNLSKLALGNIAFGVNSWRGDVYEPLLRRAIANAATTAEDSEEESPRINPNRKESPMKTYRVTVIVRVVEHYEVPAKSPHEAQELWAEGRLVHTDESALEGIVLKVEAL